MYKKAYSKGSNYREVKNDGKVTIIIAAYLRYESLNMALQSVYNQTYNNWEVIIIADCCDKGFLDKVDLSDPRVKLINLPVRCGNQYGPNSVGIHVADTEYIAYLNHDDIWLSDHLEITLNIMDKKSSDFAIGKAAFCYSINQKSFIKEKGRLRFADVNRPEFIWRSLSGPNWFFEPASSWVIKAQLAKKIGYWLSPDQSKGTNPLLNWLLRAAKAKAQFCFPEKVTCLKFELHNVSNSSKPLYLNEDQNMKHVKYYLSLNADTARQYISDDLIEAQINKLSIHKKTNKAIFIDKEQKKIKKFCKVTGANVEIPSDSIYLEGLTPGSTSGTKYSGALANLKTLPLRIKKLFLRLKATPAKSILSLLILQFFRPMISPIWFKHLIYIRTGEKIKKFIPSEIIIKKTHDSGII